VPNLIPQYRKKSLLPIYLSQSIYPNVWREEELIPAIFSTYIYHHIDVVWKLTAIPIAQGVPILIESAPILLPIIFPCTSTMSIGLCFYIGTGKHRIAPFRLNLMISVGLIFGSVRIVGIHFLADRRLSGTWHFPPAVLPALVVCALVTQRLAWVIPNSGHRFPVWSADCVQGNIGYPITIPDRSEITLELTNHVKLVQRIVYLHLLNSRFTSMSSPLPALSSMRMSIAAIVSFQVLLS
jgi:hypothetical protein